MRVVLRDRDGSGGTWIDDAPAGATHLTLTERTEYLDTGETIEDKTWGTVRVFREIAHMSTLEGGTAERSNTVKPV